MPRFELDGGRRSRTCTLRCMRLEITVICLSGVLPTAISISNSRMAAKRKGKSITPVRRTEGDVRVHQVAGGEAWEFLHPRCAMERTDDLEEVRSMISMGEAEIAKEEMRWLLDGCPNHMTGHQILGEIALEAEDFSLARGHFGHAYRVGLKALKNARMPRPVPYAREANQSFFESGKGLIYCLKKLDKRKMATEVVDVLVACDASDPLGLKALLG